MRYQEQRIKLGASQFAVLLTSKVYLMGKLQNIFLAELLNDIQIKDEPSLKRLLWIEICGNMDVVVARWVKSRIECTIQHSCTEIFPNSDMAPLRATVYVGYASVNYYSGSMGVHICEGWWQGEECAITRWLSRLFIWLGQEFERSRASVTD